MESCTVEHMFDLVELAAVDPHADEAPAPMPEDGSRDRGYKILRDIDLHPGITTMSGHLPGNVACPLGDSWQESAAMWHDLCD